MIEYCQGIAPCPQPQPPITPGGDCFACALVAGLGYLCPERPLTVAEAIEYFRHENDVVSTSWRGLQRALHEAQYRRGYPIEYTADMVQPHMDPTQWEHSWWAWEPALEYARRLEGWLRSGWVAFTEIDQSGQGMLTPDLKLRGPDHFVLLDGIRYAWEPTEGAPDGCRTYNQYVHVVCSVKGGYWIRLMHFLRRHGGSAWWLARRNER